MAALQGIGEVGMRVGERTPCLTKSLVRLWRNVNWKMAGAFEYQATGRRQIV